MNGLDIAIFGSSLVSAYWNGAATYYRGLIRALHDRGHRITFYEPDAYGRQSHRDMADPPWARVVVYPANSTQGVEQALEEARTTDVLIKASGVGVFDALLEQAIPNVASPHTTRVFWDVDAPATLDRVSGGGADPFRELIPHYDLILTYGGGDPVIRAYQALGARHCVPIYNAVDPDTHYPVTPERRFRATLAFVGNRLPDRENRVDRFLLSVAARCPARRFLLAGSGWQDKPLPPNVRYTGHLYTQDHNAFNSTPLAVLNICRDSMARYGHSPPTRVFEAAGAGACVITDHWDGVERFLEPDHEILVATDADDVVHGLDALTRRAARAMGRAARNRVLREHTYAHRAMQLESVLEGQRGA